MAHPKTVSVQILASMLAVAGVYSTAHSAETCSNTLQVDEATAASIVRALAQESVADQSTLDSILNAPSMDELTPEQCELVRQVIEKAANKFTNSSKPIV